MYLLIAINPPSTDSYHRHRMLLGVAEGTNEVVPEKALPFEFNLDYMNGGKELLVYQCVCVCCLPNDCFNRVF